MEKTREFWKRYDRQADTHDSKMTEDLSENLDVLLIFAALFSAINTAFISLTMPGLSSDPMAETNALLRLLVTRADNSTLLPADFSPPFTLSSNSVVVNCLLYASLSCSLLAAVGAMMAKEWLQSFDRTGQTGPLEEQGRFRQRKFSGVLQWHLESIIRSLPNILLLSVILFFAGVCLFLFPVNRVVAGVVIAFSGAGAVLCGVAIVAGATFPLCPYQSAASRALKRMWPLFSPLWWKGVARGIVDLVVRTPPKLVRKIFDAMHHYPSVASAITQSLPTTLLSATLGKAAISEQTEVAQAAGWLLGTTSNRADQIAAAQFICTLDRTAYAFAFEDSEIRQRLVFLTHEAFEIWHSRPTERNQEIAELWGLVLCRVFIKAFKDNVKVEDMINLPLYQSRGFGGTFLRAFEFASTNYSCHRFEDKEIILHVAFLLAITSRGPVIPEYQWTGLARFFLAGNTPHLVDVLLGLWTKFFCNIDPDKSSFHQSHAFVELLEEGDNKIGLARDLSNAVICGTRVLSSFRGNPQFELNAVRGFNACLQRAAELSNQIPLHDLTNAIDGVAGFILSYADPLTSSNPGESNSELVEVSSAAVLALHAFIGKNPHPPGIPISRGASAKLRTDDLIHATVHIMLDDSENLASSMLLPRTLPQTLARARALALARLQAQARRTGRAKQQCLRKARERKRVVELRRELGRERQLGRALELGRALGQDLAGELSRELGRELELEPELEEVLHKALVRILNWTLNVAFHGTLDGALDGTLDGVLDQVLDNTLELLLDQALNQVLERELYEMQDEAPRMAKDLAQRLGVESSIFRILLWVWKRSSSTQPNYSDRRKIFLSSFRLWAPLEKRVDFIINGIEWGVKGERLTFDDRNQSKLLTRDDLNAIVEIVEELQKDMGKFEFIRRKADVEINRLCAHFDRQIDWNYDLYDLREQRTLCCRSTVVQAGLI